MSKPNPKSPPKDANVIIRVTCRVCDDPGRRIGRLGLSTHPEDDGEPWFDGPGVEPGGFNTSTVLRCREGHNVPLRHDKLLPLLQRMRADAGPNGRSVLSVAL